MYVCERGGVERRGGLGGGGKGWGEGESVARGGNGGKGRRVWRGEESGARGRECGEGKRVWRGEESKSRLERQQCNRVRKGRMKRRKWGGD